MAAHGTLQRLFHLLALRRPLAPDGLSFPPDKLIHAVAGTTDRMWFWEGGRLGAQTLVDVLGRAGIALAGLRDVLDFGCGCGRVARHLRSLAPAARIHGTDYNPRLIRWCQAHLPLAGFSQNDLAPPTRYGGGSFDLVYAYSVFTHLTESLQRAWMDEFRRILRPGGYLLLSTHGDFYRDTLPEPDRIRFQNGDMIVWSGDVAGQNRCATFHPPAFVRERLAPAAGLDVLAFVAEGARGNPRQDAWLLQRPV